MIVGKIIWLQRSYSILTFICVWYIWIHNLCVGDTRRTYANSPSSYAAIDIDEAWISTTMDMVKKIYEF